VAGESHRRWLDGAAQIRLIQSSLAAGREDTKSMVDRMPQSSDKNAGEQWVWALVAAGVGILIILLLACVLWIPPALYPALTDSNLEDVSDVGKRQELKGARLKLQNDARTTLLQGRGGLLVLLGAAGGVYATLRQVRATREGQITDRFTNAIDQLDKGKSLAVRMGGLHALERIARDSPADRTAIAEVLCAYARTAEREEPRTAKTILAATAPGSTARPPVPKPESLTIRAPDVQTALAILGRWQERLGEAPPHLDLHAADLRGADLTGAQLQGADLTDAQLLGAEAWNVNLRDTQLFNADLRGAMLNRADLERANAGRTDFDGADLSGARLRRTGLVAASLQGADLRGADLQGANLTQAKLARATLTAAKLQDAYLVGTWVPHTDLSQAHLEDAHIDSVWGR
jgi:hypothetical protein